MSSTTSTQLPMEAGKAAWAANESIFTDEEKKTGQLLLANDQAHLFAHWPAPGTDDANKKQFLAQCAAIESAYLGGIPKYISRAKELLKFSLQGGNPFEGYKVKEPTSAVRLEKLEDFNQYESEGLKQVAQTAFVIVAGGLGERLGYKGIKLALPSQIVTETCFLELYIQYILTLQSQARISSGNAALELPLAIMTSDDTDALTRELLSKHSNFGMTEKQLIVFKQGKVPSLVDNDAHFTLEGGKNSYQLETKPHGHGDVHMLLYQLGIVEKWVKEENRKWIVFFQDTNGLVFRAITAALGVSAIQQLHINSITVPRVQGDAVGAICTLERDAEFKRDESGEQLPNKLTLNVEYNQLEGLLGKGVKEPLISGTNYSVFPGNINVLVFDASMYYATLLEKKGVISEFVNPKYNADKQTFKKPTRLECLMQDFPKLLKEDARVGFCQFQRWTSFSAVKNTITDGAEKQKQGNAAEVAATGETDMYTWPYILLKQAGVGVGEVKTVSYRNVKVEQPPKIVLHPSVGVTQAQVIAHFPGKQDIQLTNNSTLVVEGDVTFHSLKLDGTLVIKAVNGAKVKVEKLTIQNAGWEFEELKDDSNVDQKYAMRGYTLNKKGAAEFIFDKEGEYVLNDENQVQWQKHSSDVKLP